MNLPAGREPSSSSFYFSVVFLIIIFCPVIMTDVEAQEHFDNFFEEVFTELEDKVGPNKRLSCNIYRIIYALICTEAFNVIYTL